MVSAGSRAFTRATKPDGTQIMWDWYPKIGDTVMVKEHTGMMFEGDDGEDYFLYTDKDIAGMK